MSGHGDCKTLLARSLDKDYPALAITIYILGMSFVFLGIASELFSVHTMRLHSRRHIRHIRHESFHEHANFVVCHYRRVAVW